MPDEVANVVPPSTRVLVFVDCRNLVLSLRRANGGENVLLDWTKLPGFLVQAAGEVAGVTETSFRGMRVYTSYDPAKPANKKFKNWLTNWLDKQPGVHVNVKARKRKRPPKCPECHEEVKVCPHCNKAFVGTEEKGVDTAIATDMIKLAWADAYDIAVLVTSDADFIPAVEFLDQKGKRVIQAGFPPRGAELAMKCWGSFSVAAGLDGLKRDAV